MTRERGEAEKLAEIFHSEYERLAPLYGYETRPDTKEFNPESPNGMLMIAVCAYVAGMIASGKKESFREGWEFSYRQWQATGSVPEPLRRMEQEG